MFSVTWFIGVCNSPSSSLLSSSDSDLLETASSPSNWSISSASSLTCLFNFVNDNTPQFNAIPHGFVESEDKPNELFLLQFHRHSHGIVGSMVQKF
ncbi:hypothetical protein M9H77_07792 [Catharanthus roseus]|uniref:Uncharacterized protein n=1 Tax=Catharanthus roseus TaxID=4058 RepID=A0ACC0BW73_CATRO|nr:hypothetical protein M9H77_07792 [Catharanthus roseus]